MEAVETVIVMERGGACAAEVCGWLSLGGLAWRTVDAAQLVDSPAQAGVVLLLSERADPAELTALRAAAPTIRDLPVVVLAGVSDAPAEEALLAAGAHELLCWPVSSTRLLHAVRRALEWRRLGVGLARLEGERAELLAGRGLAGHTPAIRELQRQLVHVAESELPVCIRGEAGSGKERVARTLHAHSPRRGGPFVVVNCAALAKAQHVQELFGRAASPADGRPLLRGALERPADGTLFLEQVGSLSLEAQAGLAQALGEGAWRRPGGLAQEALRCRVVTGVRGELEPEVMAGRFREDLFVRLCTHPLTVPPLRERRDDVPLLVAQLLRELREAGEGRAERVAPAALDLLLAHDWPGNLTELRAVLGRALLSCAGEELDVGDLPPELVAAVRGVRGKERSSRLSAAVDGLMSVALAVHREGGAPREEEIVPVALLEQRELVRALAATGGNVARAARLLGLGRATLYRRMAELDPGARAVAMDD